MVVGEPIPKGSYISESFCKFFCLVSFLNSVNTPKVDKSLFFLQDKPSIFILFNFRQNFCFVKA